jgi:hypothetical protein
MQSSIEAKTKTAKCKVCACPFTKTRPLQTVCSPTCALTLARNVTEKALAKAHAEDRKQTREKLDAMRTKPQLTKLAQQAFNEFIRERDYAKPCICCGKPMPKDGRSNAVDAGHYRSVGSAPHLRFDETNCHAQLKYCNQYLAGNHVNYRKGLIERIGQREVDLLEADQTIRKYTKEGLQEIARHYKAEARRLRKQREAKDSES